MNAYPSIHDRSEDRVVGYEFGSKDHHDGDSDSETRRYPHFGTKQQVHDKIIKNKLHVNPFQATSNEVWP